MDYFVVGGHHTWPVTNPFSRWCSAALREATLGLVQSSEEDNSQSRGILCMVVTFRAESRAHALDPLPEAVVYYLIRLVNLLR